MIASSRFHTEHQAKLRCWGFVSYHLFENPSKIPSASRRIKRIWSSNHPRYIFVCRPQTVTLSLLAAHENLPRMIWTSYAFYSAASAWNFGWIFEQMVRDETSTSQLCLALGMEAGRCDFWSENRLDAGAVLKCFPPFLSLITLR